jgi:hypothetical protein
MPVRARHCGVNPQNPLARPQVSLRLPENQLQQINPTQNAVPSTIYGFATQ